MPTFRIHSFPALYGDCLLLEYGDGAALNRVLIDGGTAGTYTRLAKHLKTLGTPAALELIVVTHVDGDHIDGMLKLFDEGVPKIACGEVWFNGYRHLSGTEEFGPVAGERLTTHLLGMASAWNKSFGRKAVVVPDDGPLPQVTLPGGLKLTLLSPGADQLRRLKKVWVEVCEAAGLDPEKKRTKPPTRPPGIEIMGPPDVETLVGEPFNEDTSEANGSSIAVLAEYAGKRALLTGDAYPSVLLRSLQRHDPGTIELDLFKLPHHGSDGNIAEQLLRKVRAKRYLVSTNGSRYNHPDKAAIARVVKFGCAPELIFNYKTKFNRMWDAKALRDKYRYRTSFAPEKAPGSVIDL